MSFLVLTALIITTVLLTIHLVSMKETEASNGTQS